MTTSPGLPLAGGASSETAAAPPAACPAPHCCPQTHGGRPHASEQPPWPQRPWQPLPWPLWPPPLRQQIRPLVLRRRGGCHWWRPGPATETKSQSMVAESSTVEWSPPTAAAKGVPTPTVTGTSQRPAAARKERMECIHTGQTLPAHPPPPSQGQPLVASTATRRLALSTATAPCTVVHGECRTGLHQLAAWPRPSPKREDGDTGPMVVAAGAAAEAAAARLPTTRHGPPAWHGGRGDTWAAAGRPTTVVRAAKAVVASPRSPHRRHQSAAAGGRPSRRRGRGKKRLRGVEAVGLTASPKGS